MATHLDSSDAKTIIKFILVSIIISAVTLVMGAAAHLLSQSYEDALAHTDEAAVLVVIDAGHGGEDGGCVGVDGTLEKTINLDVATRVRDILSCAGIKCVMTRTDDTMLYDIYGDLTDYSGKKKMYDLKNRLRMGEEHRDAVFVSIHMNSFPQSSCEGVQIYYSPNSPESALLADTVRSSVKAYLQPKNERETKRAGTSIYILNRITRPAILAECGFLSNPNECAALNSDSYKQELALCIASAIAEYVSSAAQPK